MPIQVTCTCGQTMTVDDQFAGHQVSCIHCGQVVQVPAPQPAVAPPTAPAEAAPAPAETAPAPAEAAPDTGPAGAAPGAPRQRPGKGRRTFVADWAQGMAEQWADDHADQIASDEEPSTAVCVIAGLATLAIGAFNFNAFGQLLLGSLVAQALDTNRFVEGWIGIVVVAIFTILALWTLISGISSIARKKGGASAAIPLNLVWAFMAMFIIFQVEIDSVGMEFWLLFGGIVGLCCLGTVLSFFARTQAGRYQLWLVRKQQEADGTLNP